MFNRWKRERKRLWDKDAEQSGFAWALGEYFSGRGTLAQIKAYAFYPYDPTSFDVGAKKAYRIMRQLHLTGPDQLFPPGGMMVIKSTWHDRQLTDEEMIEATKP